VSLLTRRRATLGLAIVAAVTVLCVIAPGAWAKTIRADNNTQVEIPDPGTADSAVTVVGADGPIQKVTVSLWMWGGYDEDDDIYLVAPDGTEVELSTDNGGSGNEYGTGSADASRTTFDDSAATSITAGAAPFVGTFKPEGSLATLVGKSGSQVNGTWTLRVTDDFGPSWQGALHCWSLTIECGPTRVDDTRDRIIPTSAPLQVTGLTRAIRKVRVSLYLTHPHDSALSMRLIGPDGTSCLLESDNGADVGDFGVAASPDASRAMFDDAASAHIWSGSAPFVGSFAPDEPLSVFNGKSGSQANGAWTLWIQEEAPYGDDGTLHACSLYIDQEPLTTTLTTAPATPDGHDGWYASAPTITLGRDDAGTSYRRWDSSSWTTYGGPFSAIEGIHTLTYYSADSSNNTETAKSATFRVDTVDATVTALDSSTHPNQDLYYPSRDATFTWAASDVGGSGVDGFSYSFDQTATTVPDTASEGTATSASFSGAPEGDSYFHLRVRDIAGHWSATTHRRIRVDRNPTFDLTSSKTVVPYGGSVVLIGSLSTSAGPLPGQVVTLWRRTSASAAWQADGTAAYDPATGTYRAARTLLRNTYFEMRFAGDSTYVGASSTMLARARCWMSKPTGKPSVRRRMRFTVTGLVKPYHSGKSKIAFFRKIGKRWVRSALAKASNKAYHGYTKYTLKYRLTKAGMWYVATYHSDGDHAASYGPARYFHVR
jgi:subtilisin-like proprotein convertase family protein